MEDFNFEQIDWNTWSTPSNESCITFKFIERVRDNYYYQHVTKPTTARIDHEPHILDLLLTNEEGMLSDLEYCSPLGKSDHSLLQFNFHCYIQQENIDREKYYYDKANFSAMKEDLSVINWNDELDDMNVTEQWKVFKDRLYTIQDKYVLKRKPRSSQEKKGKTNVDVKTLKKLLKRNIGAGQDSWNQEMVRNTRNTANIETKLKT